MSPSDEGRQNMQSYTAHFVAPKPYVPLRHILSPGVNIVHGGDEMCRQRRDNLSPATKCAGARSYGVGDPLSPYLFIIAVDSLARIMIQENIKGFQINSQNIKMTQYVDDLTLMLPDMNSINEALSIGIGIGTIGMLTGAWKNQQDLPHNINWTNKPIKLLSIYISNNSVNKLGKYYLQ